MHYGVPFSLGRNRNKVMKEYLLVFFVFFLIHSFTFLQVNKVTEGLQDAADNVKKGVKGAADKVADAAKKVTGQK